MSHSDSSQQALGNIGDNNTDEEDDGLQPAVAQDDGQDEEGHAQEHGHAGDDLDEVLDLLGDGRLTHFQTRRQRRNAAHHCPITCSDHYAIGCPCTNTYINQFMCERKKRGGSNK